MLDELFSNNIKSNSSHYAVINYDYIHKELSKKEVTLTLLWQEYCEHAYANGETPYMSTQKKKYTQKEIAEYLNITQQAYAHYENGKSLIDIEKLKKLADLYQISLDILS